MNITFKNLIEKILPNKIHLFIRYNWLRLRGNLDNEMFYVARLNKGSGRFLDIGSNVGIWSYFMRNKFSKIDSFEPLSELTYRLTSLGLNHIKVNHMALSNTESELKFYIPIVDGTTEPSLASLEKRPGKCEERFVAVNTLDSFEFDDVELIKIDVERHEINVLKGASEKILKNNNVIMQIEIQKNLKNEVFSFLEKNNFKFINSISHDHYFKNYPKN